MAPPRVSVILPAYNAASTLPSVIGSLLSQTFTDWECILVDDGSTDDTAAVARRLAGDDMRFRIVRNVQNLGLPATLNKALLLSRGELIARVDADDPFKPERFERQVAFLDENPDVDVLGTAALVTTAGAERREVRAPLVQQGRAAATLDSSIVFHSSTMIHRRFFEVHGLYDTAYPRAEDRELWIRALVAGAKIANLPEPLTYYETGGYARSYGAIRDKSLSALKIGRRYQIPHYRWTVLRGVVGLLLIRWGLYRPKSIRNTA